MIESSRTKIHLNGLWSLQPTNDDVVPVRWNHSVQVPALVDIAEPRVDWSKFKYFWHRTTFTVSAESPLAFVVIEQAMFGTDVWLNGKYLGGDIACYTSQEYDARSALKVGENELVVRIGQREHLPPHSAVGKDQERTEWIPGIWGDVYLVQSGNPRIKLLQIIPHIETATAEVRVTIENLSSAIVTARLVTDVREKKSGSAACKEQQQEISLEPGGATRIILHHQLDEMHLWSPESPFLYELHANLLPTSNVDAKGGSCVMVFGMREFKIVGRHFYLNGKKILLRGGNIAFHRFLSDADRGRLPWDLDWVKRLLIDIPKAHNFNIFRNHIGQLYNRWYEIADEHGMLIQNEWMFWTTSGTKEQITKEFTLWLHDNWNHPSVIIWDPLNESSDDVVQQEIVPAMKQLDPTRPWESVDFLEEHPYIYSLGPVMNDRKFGFARMPEDIEHSTSPTMLNEFCWWWLDKEFNPSFLTKDVVTRWLGPNPAKEEMIAHQSFLVTELVELFRRMKVDAIQPFVYLSNNAGPTANWFVGNIAELKPKPILAALKNAFAPLGVSIELWDRHFFTNEIKTLRVFVFNDLSRDARCTVRFGLTDAEGEWIFETTQSLTVEATSSRVLSLPVSFPAAPATMNVRAEVMIEQGELSSYSQKIAHVLETPVTPPALVGKHIGVFESGEEISEFLHQGGIKVSQLSGESLHECNVLIFAQDAVRRANIYDLTKFLNSGKTIILIEPEFGVESAETIPVSSALRLKVERREDLDKGGYDSYVFAEDIAHPIWAGIHSEHLKMFNGAYGGEVVSQHNVSTSHESRVLARCGLHLAVPALFEIPAENGRVIVCRMQLRKRLIAHKASSELYARRPDPVLQRLLLNLLAYACAGETNMSANEGDLRIPAGKVNQ